MDNPCCGWRAERASRTLVAMSQRVEDPRLGRVELAYPDSTMGAWGVLLGVALALGGAIVLALITTQKPSRKTQVADLAAGLGLGGFLAVSGVALVVWVALAWIRRPEWWLCERGLVRRTTKGSAPPLFWDEMAQLEILRFTRYGHVVACRLRAGKRTFFVPNEEIAHRAVELWTAAQPKRAVVR